MTLSITQKLTATVALLSLLVLAPAGAALYLLMERGVEDRGIAQANGMVATAAGAMLRQLDEDLLVEFGGGHVQFEKLRVPAVHWSVVRANGQVQGAEGIFGQSPQVALGAMTQLMRLSESTVFAVASAPMVSETPMRWEEMPPPVRMAVTARVANADFISVRKEILGERVLFDIKLLTPHQLLSMEITDAGILLETEQHNLPTHLSAGMEARLWSEQIMRAHRIVDWQACNGELVAIVEGEAPDGRTVRAAINRFGERYRLPADGRVAQMQEDSRLWLVVAHDMTSDFAHVRRFGQATVVGGAMIWLLILLVAWQVTKRALRPVDDMVRQTAQIDTPDLSERLPVGAANDELSRVARTVNKMLDRIEDGYRRERQFTGDASHEMRNPLAKMLGEIDWVLSRERSSQEYKETLARLQGYAQGMQRLTESLLILARLDGKLQRLEMKPFDCADSAIELVKTLPPGLARRIRLELGESCGPMEAVGHRHLIDVLLRNLVDNALRYSPPESPVDLRIHRVNDHIQIEVQDTGPGIPPEQATLAFNRFHRLEGSRSRQTGGTGLGLSIVQVIAEVHGTKVHLSTGTAGGTLATFTLPSANGDVASDASVPR